MKLNRFAQDLLAGKWVELMHAGKYNGFEMSSQILQDMAANYDPNFRSAPLVIGHGTFLGLEGEREAHGQVADLRVVADVLQAKFINLSETVIAGLKSGKWINRSIEAMKLDHTDHNASHPDDPKKGYYYLTALALLGGSQPAVPAMFKSDAESLCIDCDAPESKSPEIEKHESTPTNNKGSKMNPEELARLKAVEDKLAAQAAESATILAAVNKQTEALTALSTKVGELTALKTDYDALSASTTALVDAQAQLAVNEATKGIPKALCPDEKKASLLSLYKTDRKAFDIEAGICATMRDKFGYLTTEVVKDADGNEVAAPKVAALKDAVPETVDVAQKAANLRAADPKLSYEQSVKLAAKGGN